MLHTKFQGHQSMTSGEEDYLRFFLYKSLVAILGMRPEQFEHILFPPALEALCEI